MGVCANYTLCAKKIFWIRPCSQLECNYNILLIMVICRYKISTSVHCTHPLPLLKLYLRKVDIISCKQLPIKNTKLVKQNSAPSQM